MFSLDELETIETALTGLVAAEKSRIIIDEDEEDDLSSLMSARDIIRGTIENIEDRIVDEDAKVDVPSLETLNTRLCRKV